MRGEIKVGKYKNSNLITTNGLQYIAGVLSGLYQIYIGYGTGTSEAQPHDIYLAAETGRVLGNISPVGNTFVIRSTISGADLDGVTEFGLFSGPNVSQLKNSGILIARTVFSEPLSFEIDDIAVVEWIISLEG